MKEHFGPLCVFFYSFFQLFIFCTVYAHSQCQREKGIGRRESRDKAGFKASRVMYKGGLVVRHEVYGIMLASKICMYASRHASICMSSSFML